jgi:biotin operon repressor
MRAAVPHLRRSSGLLAFQARRLKALGHPLRILLINLIQRAPRHGEELAAILHIHPSTVAHHLLILQQSGWISSRRDQYYQIYAVNREALNSRLSEQVNLPGEDLDKHVDMDAYRRQVLDEFLKDGRLDEIPSAKIKRDVVLSEAARSLDENRTYAPDELNRSLVEVYDDVAALRSALLEGGWIEQVASGFRRMR